MSLTLKKISIKRLERSDFETIANATKFYSEILQRLLKLQNTAQQHLHLNILSLMQYDLAKRLTARTFPVRSSLTVELFSAFVLNDALHNYLNVIEDPLERSITWRLAEDLGSRLPKTSDSKKFTVSSIL